LGLRVLVITKEGAAEGSTRWAQGGIAVVLGQCIDGVADTDSPARHVEDTLAAGAGLCDPAAVEAVISDGPRAVRLLRERGAVFDPAAGGGLARTREGGHSAYRVIHAGGDATGAEVERALLATVLDGSLPVLERHVAGEIVHTASGAIGGVLVLDPEGVVGMLRAPAVLLATGGAGQLYRATTNPGVATADGVALGLRAGAVVADLEFVQFHPTVLFAAGETGSRPLVTEAVRGEGAVLLDTAGGRVMAGVHPLADLAPRDVVSLAATRRMAETGADHVLLDATMISGFGSRFPTVHAACTAAGVDPAREPIPVAPAAHFSCGGIATTVDGRTGVPGLYAAGEVARTGLHGANRLASNSLLEGLVVGGRVADAVASDLAGRRLGDPRTAEAAELPAAGLADRGVLQEMMSRCAGIGRDAAGLALARKEIEASAIVRPLRTRQTIEDGSLTIVARTLLLAAAARTESRGAHVRTDRPDRDDARWRHTQRVRLDVSGQPILIDPVPVEAAA
ncbi:MAG: L-aspartate oxidase, partial [Sciscionella sp.]